jgi:hypothetical protein
MNRKKLEVFFGILTIPAAFFSWFFVRSAIIVPGSSVWAVPMILFLIYFILICLNIMLFEQMLWLMVLLIFSFLLSIFFVFSWMQLIAIAIASYFMLLAARSMRDDMEINTKIRPWKSMQAGKTYMLFAVTLLITMQYYLTIRDYTGVKKVPKFDTSFITNSIAIPIISSINPQFKSLKDETLTVDQFILQTQDSIAKNNFSSIEDDILDAQIPVSTSSAQKELMKSQAKKNFQQAQDQILQKNQELNLKIGRNQFSEMLGREINGDEKIADVFSGIIDSKINEYFNPSLEKNRDSSVFSLILSVALLLTVYPVGLVLCIFVFLFVTLMIYLLIQLGWLKIKTVTVIKESIE